MGQTKVQYHTVEWNDEKFKLAKLTKGRDVPVEEKIKITQVVCSMYETDDHTLEECCQKCGISVRTFNGWTRSITEITDSYNESDKQKSRIYMQKLRIRARTNAERLLDGYTVELTEREAEPVADSDGNIVMKTTKVKRKEVFIRPSVKLTETVLYNADSRNFEKNPKPVEKLNKDVDIPIIDWVE